MTLLQTPLKVLSFEKYCTLNKKEPVEDLMITSISSRKNKKNRQSTSITRNRVFENGCSENCEIRFFIKFEVIWSVKIDHIT